MWGTPSPNCSCLSSEGDSGSLMEEQDPLQNLHLQNLHLQNLQVQDPQVQPSPQTTTELLLAADWS